MDIIHFLYRRQETSTKPQRTETTVVFLPDVWSVMPNGEEYQNMANVKRPRTVPARRGTERPIAQKAAELTGKVEGKKV